MEKKKKKGYSAGRIVLIAVGALLLLDTLFVLTRSSPNLGVVLPAAIGLPLLLIGVFLPAFKRLCGRSRVIRALAFLLSVLYAAFGLLFAVTTGQLLTASSEPDDGADVLIVLGSGIRGNSPTLTMKYRLDAALGYLERNPGTAVIVSGGKGGDEQLSEAAVMREYLIAHGIPDGRILVEDESRSTEENFRFSKRIIDERFGPEAKVVFVTTRFHVFRSERVALKEGLRAEGISAKGVWYITPNDYLRESLAIASYFVKGKI